MGVLFVEGTVIGPAGKQENLKFLLDSGVTYTVLPRKVWRATGLMPTNSVKFVLEDGTQVKRKLSECQIALAQGKRHTPVILGAENDPAVLAGSGSQSSV
jgi:predicted aspartyl protease